MSEVKGKQSLRFAKTPFILNSASVVGKKEGEGPLGEYFDVMPTAQAVNDYLLAQVREIRLPRKLKVGFSNGPANETHATFRDLGFVACADGTFDVYCAGGLGANPKMGVLVDTMFCTTYALW